MGALAPSESRDVGGRVTRVAIVAASEEIASALAAALGESGRFDVVAIAESAADVPADVELLLVARPVSRGRALRDVAPNVAMDRPALTDREREILSLLADGLGNKQIAARLGISTSTVKTHLELLFEKLDAGSRTEAVAAAIRLGLLLL